MTETECKKPERRTNLDGPDTSGVMYPVPGSSKFLPCECPAPDDWDNDTPRNHAGVCQIFGQAHPEHLMTKWTPDLLLATPFDKGTFQFIAQGFQAMALRTNIKCTDCGKLGFICNVLFTCGCSTVTDQVTAPEWRVAICPGHKQLIERYDRRRIDEEVNPFAKCYPLGYDYSNGCGYHGCSPHAQCGQIGCPHCSLETANDNRQEWLPSEEAINEFVGHPAAPSNPPGVNLVPTDQSDIIANQCKTK